MESSIADANLSLFRPVLRGGTHGRAARVPFLPTLGGPHPIRTTTSRRSRHVPQPKDQKHAPFATSHPPKKIYKLYCFICLFSFARCAVVAPVVCGVGLSVATSTRWASSSGTSLGQLHRTGLQSAESFDLVGCRTGSGLQFEVPFDVVGSWPGRATVWGLLRRCCGGTSKAELLPLLVNFVISSVGLWCWVVM